MEEILENIHADVWVYKVNSPITLLCILNIYSQRQNLLTHI